MNPFIEIITQPDNIAIVIMIIMVSFFMAWAFQQAFENDRRLAAGLPVEGENDNFVDTFKPLVRIELIIALVVMVGLTIWSIAIDAPLEEIANPTITPNPAKAPWYFLGLQELLVYFDPWLAGVVLPSLIVVGLLAIPYIDINPKGNGYYTFAERKYAIIIFSFGFFVLWLLLIVIGVFFRGPGWLWYWPWQEWDHARVVFEPTKDLTSVIGIDSRSIPGIIIGADCRGFLSDGRDGCTLSLLEEEQSGTAQATGYGPLYHDHVSVYHHDVYTDQDDTTAGVSGEVCMDNPLV